MCSLCAGGGCPWRCRCREAPARPSPCPPSSSLTAAPSSPLSSTSNGWIREALNPGFVSLLPERLVSGAVPGPRGESGLLLSAVGGPALLPGGPGLLGAGQAGQHHCPPRPHRSADVTSCHALLLPAPCSLLCSLPPTPCPLPLPPALLLVQVLNSVLAILCEAKPALTCMAAREKQGVVADCSLGCVARYCTLLNCVVLYYTAVYCIVQCDAC